MNKGADICDVGKNFRLRVGEIQEEYKQELMALLSDVGMDKDVINRNGVRGRLVVEESGFFSTMKYCVKFFPYTKRGTVSKRCDEYCYSLSGYKKADEEGAEK